MPALKVKTKSGQIQTLTVEELLEVDGKPYRDDSGWQEHFSFLEGRIQSLENLLRPSGSTEQKG